MPKYVILTMLLFLCLFSQQEITLLVLGQVIKTMSLLTEITTIAGAGSFLRRMNYWLPE